jgi:hypothetical protein
VEVARRVALGDRPWIAGLLAALVISLSTVSSAAFELDGHEVIEATAYKRLLALGAVPGTGQPPLSGRALLAALIETGILAEPPCFDRARPVGDCGATQRLELPLRYWPTLGSGVPDLVIDRQLGQRGQCQHFMADTADGLTPDDPRFGVPGGLATAAYLRCTRVIGSVFDGILRDPRLAGWRIVGTYVLMHALEDSFSAAHVERSRHFEIVHLLSWTLIDWPLYLLHGRWGFPASTHHALSDQRDSDYLRWDARTKDGRTCRDLHHPYAFPEACLTERAKAAVATVVDFLVLTYRLRARATAEGRPASLFPPAPSSDAAEWLAFVREDLPSVAVTPELPSEPHSALPRADVFVGAQGVAGSHLWGAGLWGARLFMEPAAPFLLGLGASGGIASRDGVGELVGAAQLSLFLPLVRRFAVGAAPAGLQVVCEMRFQSCQTDVVATLGELLVPLGETVWFGVEGPRWSWTQRSVGPTWLGVTLGWSHETLPRFEPPSAEAGATWDPPVPDEVRAFRRARSSRAVFLAATAASRSDVAFVGAGLDWRWDRDRWNRRAGLVPELQVEIDGGRIDSDATGASLAVAPTLRAYLRPNRIALTATPALIRVGALSDHALALDVAARAGIALELGRLELEVDSPPLSYVSQARWHALPITVRLGLRFD